jgi:pimeloyl-ACP methyl ester carboxylesterase
VFEVVGEASGMTLLVFLLLAAYCSTWSTAFNNHHVIRRHNKALFSSTTFANNIELDRSISVETAPGATNGDRTIVDSIPVMVDAVPTIDSIIHSRESVMTAAFSVLGSRTVSIYRDTSHEDESLFTKKQPLLFLPGLDGIGNYSASAIGKLNSVFEVWKMATIAEDRSNFMELAAFVIKAVEVFDEPVTLVGESFGGLLAAYVALRAKKGTIGKLVLINPATSFDKTNWNLVAPIIANTGIAFPLIGMSALLATAVDIAQIQRVGFKIASTMTTPESALKVANSLLGAGKFLLDLIPAETLAWRISKWFGAGTTVMEGKYSQILAPTLILVGKNDRLLPSRAEGRRLKKEMTGSSIVEVKEFDIGHALLEDGFVDFTETLLKSQVFAVPKEETLDCPMPTKEDMDNVDKQVHIKDYKDSTGVEQIPQLTIDLQHCSMELS